MPNQDPKKESCWHSLLPSLQLTLATCYMPLALLQTEIHTKTSSIAAHRQIFSGYPNRQEGPSPRKKYGTRLMENSDLQLPHWSILDAGQTDEESKIPKSAFQQIQFGLRLQVWHRASHVRRAALVHRRTFGFKVASSCPGLFVLCNLVQNWL